MRGQVKFAFCGGACGTVERSGIAAPGLPRGEAGKVCARPAGVTSAERFCAQKRTDASLRPSHRNVRFLGISRRMAAAHYAHFPMKKAKARRGGEGVSAGGSAAHSPAPPRPGTRPPSARSSAEPRTPGLEATRRQNVSRRKATDIELRPWAVLLHKVGVSRLRVRLMQNGIVHQRKRLAFFSQSVLTPTQER